MSNIQKQFKISNIIYNKYVIITIMLLLSCNLYAQNESNYTTDEVVVSVSRYEEHIKKVNEAISVLNLKVIEMNNSLNLANALTGNAGIWMQQTNHGGGSPFLRGFTGNQTLIMIDGIRLNNSTFRYGPNQYLNTINLNSINRVEILRGSGSVQYGSDAIGGVVHIITKSPKIGLRNKLNGGMQLKYLSDDMEKSGSAYMSYSTSNSGYQASFSYKKFGDLVAGDGLDKESPSSYDELALNIKNSHMLTDKMLLTYNYQYLKQIDVDRFDQVSQRGYKYYKFDPQVRQLAYVRNEIFTGNDLANKISFTLSWQQSNEDRKKQKKESAVKTKEEDDVTTIGANFLVLSKINNNWDVNSGIDYYYDYVNSSKTESDELANSVEQKRGLYTDGSKAHNFSLFSLSNLRINDLEVGFGARYNFASLIIKDKEFGEPDINPNAVTGYLELAYNISNNVKVISKVNTAYRIPNINDISSFGLFDYGIEVPNSDLSPERSVNYQVGIKFNSKKLFASLFGYRTNLQDLIGRVKAQYNNSSTYNGDQVYMKKNLGEAYVQGIELSIDYQLFPKLLITKHFNYTYGQNESKVEPMRRIPPVNGSLSMYYDLTQQLAIRFEYLYALKQDRLSGGDIDDHRISDGGTPSWNVINLYSNYSINPFVIGIGINNILNENYRMHGSGIDGIGRSIQFTARYNY